MKDMQAHLEMLRTNIAECERLHRAAKSKIKSDIFKRLAVHYKVLAGELEQALERSKAVKDQAASDGSFFSKPATGSSSPPFRPPREG